MKLAACVPLLFLLAPGAPPRAETASDQLAYFDKTTLSGYLQARVSVYGPPDGKGRYPAPKVYPANVLFERPDRFRIVLNPGEKNEYRAVAVGGIARWVDFSTGLSGKDAVVDLVDPLAVGLLDSAGELSRFGAAGDLPLGKDAPISAVRTIPAAWGTSVAKTLVFFGAKGEPVGFDFSLHDGSRLFFAVTHFRQNPDTSPEDFEL